MEELAYISLAPSRVARYVHLGATLLALLAFSSSGMAGGLKIILASLLVVVSIWQWRKGEDLPVLGFACVKGQWCLWTPGGEHGVEMMCEPLVLSWLVVLQWRYKESGKRCALALWPDSASQDDLRRLRVFLRFGPVS
jgi:hypothetical protein